MRNGLRVKNRSVGNRIERRDTAGITPVQNFRKSDTVIGIAAANCFKVSAVRHQDSLEAGCLRIINFLLKRHPEQ